MVERRRTTAEKNGDSLKAKSHAEKPNISTRKTKRRRGGKDSYSSNPNYSLGIWGSRALLLVAAGMYSTNFASVKYLETLCVEPPCEHDPSETSFMRFLLSAVICLPILYNNRQHWELIKAGVEIGFWYTVNYVCQAESLEYIPAGKCAFISALEVVSVPIFAGVFLGKKIQPINVVSASVALFGVAILENLIPIGIEVVAASPAKLHNTIFGIGIGDILALGQPLGFGYAVMRIEYYMEKFSDVPNRVLTLTASQCVTVCGLTFVWMLVDCHGQIPDLSYMMESHYLIALGWTGIVTSVGVCVVQGIALQKASATDAALIFSSEPIWGSLFARWLLKEQLNTATYIGGFFILLACVLGSLGGSHDSTPTNPTKQRMSRLKSKQSDVSPSSNDSLLPTLHINGETATHFERSR
jgi:drug/metabolite transporter (DMT)-like permease